MLIEIHTHRNICSRKYILTCIIKFTFTPILTPILILILTVMLTPTLTSTVVYACIHSYMLCIFPFFYIFSHYLAFMQHASLTFPHIFQIAFWRMMIKH